MDEDSGLVKVIFELEIEEDGFPPIGTESLNAVRISEDSARLDNTPFFAGSVALGDVARCAKTSRPGIYRYEELLIAGGSKAISVIILDQDCKESISRFLDAHGCFHEYGDFGRFRMFAVEVDSSTDYGPISKYLDEQEKNGRISYAELCI